MASIMSWLASYPCVQATLGHAIAKQNLSKARLTYLRFLVGDQPLLRDLRLAKAPHGEVLLPVDASL